MKTKAWIPRKLYFKLKNEGKLNTFVALDRPLITKKSKKKKVKRIKITKFKFKKIKKVKNPRSKVEYEYTVFVKGEEKGTIKGKTFYKAEEAAKKQFGSTRILLSKIN